MPSDLPVIKVRTHEDNIVKIKTIAEYNNRSVSKEVEKLILDHIAEFEQKYGEITIGQMTPKEVAQDIRKRIMKNPPYGENVE